MQFWDGMKNYISDFIDIIIVSYIFYQLLILLRGTRAFQLLKGISVVIAVWFVSNFFHLRTVQWIIENLFSVGMIALIIIFQPEFRRALEQIGQRGFFSRSYSSDDQLFSKMVGEITKATSYFSQNQVGSLIVVERETGLSDYIKTGVQLDAILSTELLKNIFYPNSPLHDGALIIRGQKIRGAGCFLPLSENLNISKELGTRHRAGIGLSELSDAVVVMVSEETGQVSLAIHGELEQDLTEEQLISRLYEELKQPDRNLGSFWRLKRDREDASNHE